MTWVMLPELAAAVALTVASTAVAKEPSVPPTAVQDIARCRAITDDAARLRCFDGAADRLASALSSKEVFVLDRSTVRETRRSLFGLPLPKDGVISDDADERVKVDHLESTVARATQTGDGNWVVTLEQGGVWQQTDGYQLAHGPRNGDKVTISRGALGSFRMKILSQAAVKARRVY